ncbi:conserved Plasmodium protein, unknown function [Plasmodium knowlesi strain H]|uniref:Tetratricopeptide repeat protein n=3 Tax=Plasmodium knowlesi TaxID=5850 RepID=A0A5K1VAR6_PLAKH|nr:tetratricopeptide repeat protein, putative [Plasmodium knowlesi strain H]OTN67255.1 Uncharacterized protein PKNOH_S06426500 [Plasmodium knowlesi]CAA9987536.1 tetratricopeptide repeat protein, putative [Plasmodium knowlesi strain H]SBO23103.1 conserved Plasmodium protein, unknown function [Plasmodium knowlesi strain H]SBO23757.1 conserved Plasmodium protein, unknown function [Plasmodium knowlesi strain H]VVS77010.1 tetratricopeptide repeat protein, putative [Plasmodium knowlesi strain H]|eukprot:XP_002258538.1 hypothetical protein, conserved in Plasmodium species [Plasmodium knowlesi strain H]
MRLKDARAAMNSMTSPRRKKKKKEEIFFEYIRNSNSQAIQLLNWIWLYCFYQKIKTLTKNVRELQNGKSSGPLLVKYLLTLRLNIDDAYEYFRAILSTALKIYGEKKDQYILHIGNAVGRRNNFSVHEPLCDVYSGDSYLKDLPFREHSYVNNIIDIFYAERCDRRDDQPDDQRGEREALHSSLEVVRICISNLFKILGDLHRYKCYFFEENREKNEMKACMNYYKALSYYRYSGHLFNQLTLLYTGGNPIECLFLYFLSLIAVKPAPNRDALVMYMESVLNGGKSLANLLARLRRGSSRRCEQGQQDGSVDLNNAVCTPCRGETSCKLGRGIFYIKAEGRHFLPSMKGSERGTKDTIYYQRDKYHGHVNTRVNEKHTERRREGGSNSGQGSTKEKLTEKELNEAIINFYMSYFKIVKLLFSKIDMNKFEKKKNKFIYYTNRYIKLQYYSRREDTLMLKNIILIIFTLLSLVIYVTKNQHDQGHKDPGGFLFYGNINVSKYVYRKEQIYFSFLLIHELLLSCEEFYANFFPSYLSVFIYVLYWFRKEPSVWDGRLVNCTEEDNRERDHLVKQYHEDYRGKSVYGSRAIGTEKTTFHSTARRSPWGGKRDESLFSKQSNYNEVVKNSCDDPEFSHNKDIIKSIKDLLMGIEVREEMPLNDNSLLRYKLREDFYIYPFLSGLHFRSLEGGGKYSTGGDCKMASSQLSSLSNVAYPEISPNKVDMKCSQVPFEGGKQRGISRHTNFDELNEEDVVLLKNPLFVRASSMCTNGEMVNPRDDVGNGLNCYNDLYELSSISGNNVHSSGRKDGSNDGGHADESVSSGNASRTGNNSRRCSDGGVAFNAHGIVHPEECYKGDHYIAAVYDIPNDEFLQEVGNRVRIMRFRSLTQNELKESDKESRHVRNVCKKYLDAQDREEIHHDNYPSEEDVGDIPHVAGVASPEEGSQKYTTPIVAGVCKNEMSCTMSRSDDDNRASNLMRNHQNGVQDKSHRSGSCEVCPDEGISQNDYFNYSVLEKFQQDRVDASASMPNGIVENDRSCKHLLGGKFNSSNEIAKANDKASLDTSLDTSLEDMFCPSSPAEADSILGDMAELARIPFEEKYLLNGEGQTHEAMGNSTAGDEFQMGKGTLAVCKGDSSPSVYEHAEPHHMYNGKMWMEEGNSTIRKMVILDGKNIGTRYQDNYKKYFDSFRIKVVLDYYKIKKYVVKIVLPEEYLIRGRNDLLGENSNSSYYDVRVHSSMEGDDFILTGNDLLFFQNLHILGCLIVHPLESYYPFCVNLVQRWNSCFVTNVTLSELNMKIREFDQLPLKNIAAHFISYTFLGDDFLPNPTFRWPTICRGPLLKATVNE